MSVRPIDTFITNSVKLFEANPSQATISITYAHNPELERTRVTFRSSNPHLNSTYKFATNKSKDVSRLLNALGPRGVTVVPGKIEKQVLRKQGKKSKKRYKSVNVVGIGNLIANVRVKQVKPATERRAVKAAATTTTTTSSSNNTNNNSNSNTSGGGNNNASSNTNANEPTSSVSSKKNKGKGKSKGKGKGKGKK